MFVWTHFFTRCVKNEHKTPVVAKEAKKLAHKNLEPQPSSQYLIPRTRVNVNKIDIQMDPYIFTNRPSS